VTFGSAQVTDILFVLQSVLAKHPQASQMDWPKEVVYYKVAIDSAQVTDILFVMQSVLAKHPQASQMDVSLTRKTSRSGWYLLCDSEEMIFLSARSVMEKPENKHVYYKPSENKFIRNRRIT